MAARDKERFYWLKLNRNFFKRHDITILEGMPGGRENVLLYLKLMAEAIDHKGELRYSDKIPYTPEMLALVTRSSAEIVQQAMDAFRGLGLMETKEDGTLYFPEVAKLLDSETYQTLRKRESANAQSEVKNTPRRVNPTQDIDTDKDTEADKEKDKDTDTEKEKDTEKEVFTVSEDTVCRTKDVRRVMEAWNSLGLQQITKLAPDSSRGVMLKARIRTYGLDAVLEAIEKVRKSAFLNGQNSKNWVITFEWFVRPNNFPKVLEGNYDNGRGKTGQQIETANPFLKMLMEDEE